ncbi:peptide MFS transporter [Shewanella sp. A32]|uniref:peptide MFS transporter n=1 Tax=Shewanella sp. A32 TaxID=3031327 RepID=UPI0023B9AEBF|nr:peptide MFS transporter [Shewanella sp. A32]MDF0533006.1 peptide MFS transporter [Shewanella sp. A32]
MSPAATDKTFLGHPQGLYLLFTTELWERFSYYAMRAILVLYLVDKVRNEGGYGLGWDQDDALRLYAAFTGLFYLTPLFGGWLADNVLGQRKAIYLGGTLMALGQFSLGLPHHWISGYETVMFYLGLAGLVLGNGLFKPNISTMVGDLYPKGDHRRDGAFTIFYMGINLGAFLSAIVVGTVVRYFDGDYQAGFVCAGIGMLLSLLLQFLFAQKLLGDIGTLPSAKLERLKLGQQISAQKTPLTKVERDRIKVILIMGMFTAIFWAGFEQAGGLFNLFALNFTDRMIGDWEVPTEWFQSLNSLFIFILAPIVASVWIRCGEREPNSPVKFAMALGFLAIGFLFMIAAVLQVDESTSAKASMLWLVAAYFFHTLGELSLSPIGLSMVTKLAPLRLISLMMGSWFVFTFIGNYTAGMVGSLIGNSDDQNMQLNNVLAIFAGIAIAAVIAGIILHFMADKLVDWMHGAETNLHTRREEEVLEQELAVTATHEVINKH